MRCIHKTNVLFFPVTNVSIQFLVITFDVPLCILAYVCWVVDNVVLRIHGVVLSSMTVTTLSSRVCAGGFRL